MLVHQSAQGLIGPETGPEASYCNEPLVGDTRRRRLTPDPGKGAFESRASPDCMAYSSGATGDKFLFTFVVNVRTWPSFGVFWGVVSQNRFLVVFA